MYLILRIFQIWTGILLGLMIVAGIIAGLVVTISKFDNWVLHNYKPYEPYIMIGLILVVASLFAAIVVALTDWKENY